MAHAARAQKLEAKVDEDPYQIPKIATSAKSAAASAAAAATVGVDIGGGAVTKAEQPPELVAEDEFAAGEDDSDQVKKRVTDELQSRRLAVMGTLRMPRPREAQLSSLSQQQQQEQEDASSSTALAVVSHSARRSLRRLNPSVIAALQREEQKVSVAPLRSLSDAATVRKVPKPPTAPPKPPMEVPVSDPTSPAPCHVSKDDTLVSLVDDVSPVPERREEDLRLPFLTEALYDMSPSPAQLRLQARQHGAQALQRVDKFVVRHADYGSVEFLAPVDVRALDVCRIVRFAPMAIAVYDGRRAQKLRPPRGQGLNVPSRVTLRHVWPVDPVSRQAAPTTDAATLADFEATLRDTCDKVQPDPDLMGT
ncbi:MAG: hypothetical protein MHM6MM_009102 [Cercozoa sp. M6MM]